MQTQILAIEYPNIQPGIEMLSLDDPSDPLLDDICNKLILPYFPDEDRDGRDAIGAFLSDNNANRERKIQYRVVAAVKGATLVGATIFTFFGYDGFCFMNGQYTSVMPSERGRGLAKTLSCYREATAQTLARNFGYSELDFTIITLANPQNSPECLKEPGCPNHRTLQAIWRRWGHDLIDFPYVQLPLADGKAGLSDVLLGIKRYSDRYRERDYLTASEMKNIIDACNYFRLSKTPNERYPQYRAMLDFLRRRPQTRILV